MGDLKLTWAGARKWFDIDKKKRRFSSKRRAKTPNEGWEKTLHKWFLIGEHGFITAESGASCGLCNIYYSNNPFCDDCPVKEFVQKGLCLNTPYSEPAYAYEGWYGERSEHELMFLLMLYWMSQDKAY